MQRPVFGAMGVSEMRCNPCLGEVFSWDREQMRDLETCRCMNSLVAKPTLHDSRVQSNLRLRRLGAVFSCSVFKVDVR